MSASWAHAGRLSYRVSAERLACSGVADPSAQPTDVAVLVPGRTSHRSGSVNIWLPPAAGDAYLAPVDVLPPAVTEEAFIAVRRDEAALRPGLERLGTRLGLDPADLTRYPAGSRPVYASGDVVLKLFPPVAGWPDYLVEAKVLAAVQGKLPTATPRVLAAG